WSTFQEKVKQGPLPPPPSDTSSSDAISSVLKSLVSQLYKSADTNSDGQLSQDEMTGWLNQQSSGSTTGTTSINYAV
ncbi:MAG: hypothetical protein NTV86_22155, partial [Planctomycetota bacterium]|nr:hypothetical protein [Planctomycetota bacterium]